MNKKTLVAVVKYFYPVAAGIETNMQETYAEFVRRGWNVTVHTTNNTLTESSVLAKEDTVKGIQIRRYPWHWFGFMPDFDWEHTDTLVLHNFNIFPHLRILLLVWIRKKLGKKNPAVILVPHGGFNPEWRTFSLFSSLIKRVYHYTVGTMLINASTTAVRAVSEWERLEIIKHGVHSSRVFTVTNGIEDEAFIIDDSRVSDPVKRIVKNAGTYIIQIGRIYSIKNYETVIRAMQYIHNDIQYIIAGPIGNEHYNKALRELIASLHLESRVHFIGVVRGFDKFYLIRHARCMIHMAMWESYCNVVHEGMSQGLPCIVADNTALPLLIKNGVNGYCIPTFDEKKTAETIEFVLDAKNHTLMEKISKTNTDICRQQTWKHTAHLFEKEIYRYTHSVPS